jgi:hypothetical protein
VFALSVGLFFTWVPRLRHSHDWTAGQHKISGVAAAMHKYASTTDDGGTLPAGNWSARGVPGTGPFAAILPFVGQHGTIPTDTTVAGSVNPTDTTNRRHTPGVTSYTYNPAWLGRPAGHVSPERKGHLNRTQDGTVNTILLTEQVMNCGGTPNPWHANRGLDGIRFDANGRVTFATPPRPSNLGPDATCTPDAPSGSYRELIIVAMGDASVRSVALPVAGNASRTAGVTNWQAAVTPAGKETLGEEW